MLRPDIISLLCEITCALPHTCGVHSVLCLLSLSSASKIITRKKVQVGTLSIRLLILTHVTDLQWGQELTRPPLQPETAQSDFTLTPYRAISPMGWLKSIPRCSVWSLRLCSVGAGTPASSTRSLGFFLASPDKITPWSGAALGSFQTLKHIMQFADCNCTTYYLLLLHCNCTLPAPSSDPGNHAENPGNWRWEHFNLNSIYYKPHYHVSLET